MPNWVTNDLRIYGPRAEIQRFLDHVKTENSRFDFRPIIPRESVSAWHSPWGTARLIPEEYLKIGEIKNVGGQEEDYHIIELRFDTAWRPPIPVLFQASTLFDESEFRLTYDEESGGPVSGIYYVRDGYHVHADTGELNRWRYDVWYWGIYGRRQNNRSSETKT
jgi:hypothetical protein